MKRLLLTLGLWLLLTGSAWPFSASLNFRGTAGFVTDGSGQTYVVSDTYPTTRNGLTFGFALLTNGTTGNFSSGSVSPVDRNSGVDPRFAGIVYAAPGAPNSVAFVLDVPAGGSYDIRIATGDSGGDQSGQSEYVEIFNGCDIVAQTTGPSLGVLLNGVKGPTQNHYIDSIGTTRTSESNWISSNVAVTKTISLQSGATRLVVWLGKDSLSTYTVLAHLEVSDAAPPPSGATIKHRVTQ